MQNFVFCCLLSMRYSTKQNAAIVYKLYQNVYENVTFTLDDYTKYTVIDTKYEHKLKNLEWI